MKNIIFMVVVSIIIGSLCIGAVFGIGHLTIKEEQQRKLAFQEIYERKFELRRLFPSTVNKEESSGSFFLFMGGYSSSKTQEVRVKFAWKGSDGIYTISEVPIEKIRVKIEKVEVPYIQIRLDDDYRVPEKETDYFTCQSFLLDYIVVHCNEDQFTYKVNIDDSL